MRFSVYRLIIAFLMVNNILLFLFLGYLEDVTIFEGYIYGSRRKGTSLSCKVSTPRLTPFVKTDTADGGGCVYMNFSKERLPRTALASFPGSGNTWLRHLVEQLTGIYTGSVYNDGFLRRKFKGEGNTSPTVIGIKTHGSMQSPLNQTMYGRAVLLVRSPYDCILAEYNRQNGGHVGVAAEYTDHWVRFVDDYTNFWYKQHIVWLENGVCDILLVTYKDLKTGLEQQLKRLAEFFNVQPLSRYHLDCVLHQSEGSYKRKKAVPIEALSLYDNKRKARIDNLTQIIKQRIWNKFRQKVNL